VADTNHESRWRDLCRWLSWFVSATSPWLCWNLSQTLSQNRRNEIWIKLNTKSFPHQQLVMIKDNSTATKFTVSTRHFASDKPEAEATQALTNCPTHSAWMTFQHVTIISLCSFFLTLSIYRATFDHYCCCHYYRVFTWSSKLPATVFKIQVNCWTFAGSCEHPIKHQPGDERPAAISSSRWTRCGDRWMLTQPILQSSSSYTPTSWVSE